MRDLDDVELDAVLASLPPEQPGVALRDRVIAAAPRPRARRLAEWFGWSVGWAAAGAAGIVLGLTTPPAVETDSVLADAAAYADPLQLDLGDMT